MKLIVSPLFVLALALVPFASGHPGHDILEQKAVNQNTTKLITSQIFADLPKSLSFSLTKDGQTIDLELWQFSALSPNFCVRLDYGNGRVEFLKHDGRIHTYHGHLLNDLGSTVSAWVCERGVEAEIYHSDGSCWEIIPPEQPGSEHLIFDREVDPSTPLVDQLNEPQRRLLAQLKNPQALTQAFALPNQVTVKKAEIGFEVSNRTFREGFQGDPKAEDFSKNGNYGRGFNKDADLANRYIQSFINGMNTIYMRDALVKFEIGVVNIRMEQATCPYEKMAVRIPTLERFRDIWNGKNKDFGPSPSKTHHLAHAMIGNRGGASGYAWVGKINENLRYSIGCTSVGSGLNFWKGIGVHEILHIWGGQHGDGKNMEFSASGGSYSAGMSPGNRLRMNPVEQAKTLRERNSSKLPDLGAIPEDTRQIAPYGAFDTFKVFLGGDSILLDILANDHDANNTRFELKKFILHRQGKQPVVDNATTSRRGGKLEIAEGDGPGGRDMLRYTPPAEGIGLDQFIYTLVDETGREGMGTVRIYLISDKPGVTLANSQLKGFQKSPRAVFQPGMTRMNQLNLTEVKNDYASSMMVPLNFEVTLYKDDSLDMDAGHAIRGPGAYNLNGVRFLNKKGEDASVHADSRVSALKVTFTGPDRPHVELFTAPHFVGIPGIYNGSEQIETPGSYHIKHLKWAGIGNDQLASIRIPTGYTVTLWEDDHFEGKSITLKKSVADLATIDFAGKASSMKVTYQAPGQ